MSPKFYCPGKHKYLIIDILKQFGYSEKNLILVDNIGKWAAQNKVKSIIDDSERLSGLFDIGLTLVRTDETGNKTRLFVFTKLVPPTTVKQILTHQVFNNQTLGEFLKTEEQFIKQRVLHEVAHAVKNFGENQEQKCDEWALEQELLKI